MKTQAIHTYIDQFLRAKPALLGIAGVMTAIICSLVILNELSPPQDQSPGSRVVNARSATTRRVVEIVDLSVSSYLSRLH